MGVTVDNNQRPTPTTNSTSKWRSSTTISARIGSDESEFTSTSPVASSDAVMLVSQRPQLLPLAQLRPIVRCPTLKYNRRVRAGRGFTLTELKEAGIPRKLAPTIGISVDARRQNLSTESLAVNVERLKAYQARLILFPRKLGQHKKGDASKEDVSAAKNTISSVKLGLPIVNAAAGVSEIKKSELPTPVEGGAYRKLRDARSEHGNQGKRDKRAKEKADEAAAAKK